MGYARYTPGTQGTLYALELWIAEPTQLDTDIPLMAGGWIKDMAQNCVREKMEGKSKRRRIKR